MVLFPLRARILPCAFLLIPCALLLGSTHAVESAADLVLYGGKVYTLGDAAAKAEAVAARGGRIVFVGTSADARKLVGQKTRAVDLKGAALYPGFTDSHCHLRGIGERGMKLDLDGVGSLKELEDRLQAKVDACKPGVWVTGRGWIETSWKPRAFPTRWDLDAVSLDNPVLLTRADGHGAVANSAALKAAGITRETKDPFGGAISRDKGTGEPDGMLMDAAIDLVAGRVPPPPAGSLQLAFELGATRCLRLGWTEVQDAGGDYEEVSLLKKLYMEGRLKLRVYKAVYGPGPGASRLLADGPLVGAVGGRFTLRSIKVVLDGSLGSRSAALLAPYADAPSTSGFLTEKEEALSPLFEEALRKGIQVETHAIGDRANRTALDLYGKALAAVPPEARGVKEPRWRIEHAQILSPQDLPRFATLGVIASMQPSHAISDLLFAPARLGPERLAGAYAWQSLLKSGAVVTAGSDAPVEKGDPVVEFYAAVARKGLKGESGEGWHPEEAATRDQALKMLTLWPAYAAFQEKERGSIEVGKLADFSVFSKDLMTASERDILKARCLMTVVAGEIAYINPAEF
jgi:predicted amidohydrolase YtcJ